MAVRRARVRRPLRQQRARRPKLWPSIYSAYPGAVGFSRTFEGFGQRDEATMIAFREALEFQTTIGRAGDRDSAPATLSTQLMAGLSEAARRHRLDVTRPELRAAVVSFLPGTLDAGKLATALYEKDKIGGHDARRPGSRRPARLAAPLQQSRPRSIGCWVAWGSTLRTGI